MPIQSPGCRAPAKWLNAKAKQALKAGLHTWRHAHQYHAVRQYGHDEQADERLQYAALSAGERRSSDDDCGHGGEKTSVADLSVAQAELRGRQDATNRVEDARDGEYALMRTRSTGIPERAASSSPPPSA
jgi:hypothetical protein